MADRVNQGQTQSDQVDHQETENRTHDGDDLTPSSVAADTEMELPTASEGDAVTVPSNPDVVPVFVNANTGELLVPDLEETV
jgi:hypothetical protein